MGFNECVNVFAFLDFVLPLFFFKHGVSETGSVSVCRKDVSFPEDGSRASFRKFVF